MDESTKITSVSLRALLHAKADEMADKLVDVVNAAEAGRLINDSEEPFREVMDEFRRAVFEAAIQQRIKAAEAAFPPSGGP